MTFEISGDVKKLSIKEGDALVVKFENARLFKMFMQFEKDKNPLLDNLKKLFGEKIKVLVLQPGIELETISKDDLEKLE